MSGPGGAMSGQDVSGVGISFRMHGLSAKKGFSVLPHPLRPALSFVIIYRHFFDVFEAALLLGRW